MSAHDVEAHQLRSAALAFTWVAEQWQLRLFSWSTDEYLLALYTSGPADSARIAGVCADTMGEWLTDLGQRRLHLVVA